MKVKFLPSVKCIIIIGIQNKEEKRGYISQKRAKINSLLSCFYKLKHTTVLFVKK